MLKNRFIFSSDWHFRCNQPHCRIDNYFETQKKIIEFIFKKTMQYDAHLIIAGDIFDTPIPDNSQELENFLIGQILNYNKKVENNFFGFIAGNHDLLYHNNDEITKTSYGVINNFNQRDSLNLLQNIDFIDFGKSLPNKENKILVMHRFCSIVPSSFIKDALSISELLKIVLHKIIVIGDNHRGFIYQEKERLIINPGCISVFRSDMIGYKPFIVFFDFDSFEYNQIFIPEKYNDSLNFKIEKVSKAENDGLFEILISKIKNNIQFNQDLITNVDNYCNQNNISESVRKYIYEAMNKRKKNE